MNQHRNTKKLFTVRRMAINEKLLSATTYCTERVKAFSSVTSQETRTLMPGALCATRFGQPTEALMVSGMRRAKP